MNHLKSMTQQEIAGVLKDMGQPAFRAKQLFSWLHKGVRSYDQMTNIPQIYGSCWRKNIPSMLLRWCVSRNPSEMEP